MNRRILVATGLTVVALALASMANGTSAGHETDGCTQAFFTLLFMTAVVALLALFGAFAGAVFLAARGSRPVAYIVLATALPIVAGSIMALTTLSEACASSESLGQVGSAAAGFAIIAVPALIAALIGLTAGYVVGRLVRWFRER